MQIDMQQNTGKPGNRRKHAKATRADSDLDGRMAVNP